MEKPDQLRELFRMQQALNQRIGVQTDGMTEEEKTKWVLNYCRAMSQEMAELTDSVPWEMVGQVPEVRRTERARGSCRSVSFSHQPRASPRHERGRCLQCLREEERSELQAAGLGYAVKDHEDSKHI